MDSCSDAVSIDGTTVSEADDRVATLTASGGSGDIGLRVLAILSVLLAFAALSTDIYLPALPTMAAQLHSDQDAMAWTLSGYLIGFSIGQLLWGPIGDRYGRRLPVAVGLALFVIGSAACALSVNAGEIIGWRIVQAIGACASVVLGRAMVRDLYAGVRAAQMLSTLMTVMAIAPLLGPFVGGQIIRFASWQAIFWLLMAIGAMTLAALFTLPETLPAARRNREPLGRAWAGYLVLLRTRRVIGFAGVGGFFYGGIYAYLSGTPFAYINYYHLPAQWYGVVFGCGILGIMACNLINVRLVVRHGAGGLIKMGAAGAAVAGVVVAIDARTGFGGLPGLVAPLFVYVGLAGFIIANSIAGALESYPDRAGAVSALVGAIHYGAGVVTAGLVGAFADGTPWSMGWIIAACGLGAAGCAWLAIPGRGKRVLAR
ncbi:MAG TPA: multidrug effflux MFS transporter [Roseiarcus sp.]|jgi:DHA1 family bicyclomycin/chloramphenicol resistance-like MFS transporter